MFMRVLVPLDGSPRAERAIPLAAKIAEANKGSVILVRVVAVPVEYGPALVPPLSVSATESEREEFSGYLSNIANLPAFANVTTETAVMMGPPAQTILEVASEKQADIVVMTSHGRTGFSRWVLGSVAQKIAHHAPVPVLVLREQGPTLAGAHPDVEHLVRLLVPLDGSPLAEAVIKPAADLAAAISTKPALHLALIVSPYEAAEENMPESLMVDGAKEYLGKVTDDLKKDRPEISVTWSVGVGLDVAATIIRIAENGDDTEGAGVFGGCDAIAIATHGRTGFAHWALGSTTERVLHGTNLPLLIVRPPKAAAAARAAVDAERSKEPVEVAASGGQRDETGKLGEGDQSEGDIPAWSALF